MVIVAEIHFELLDIFFSYYSYKNIFIKGVPKQEKKSSKETMNEKRNS